MCRHAALRRPGSAAPRRVSVGLLTRSPGESNGDPRSCLRCPSPCLHRGGDAWPGVGGGGCRGGKPCPSRAVTAHAYFMADNGISLSIPLPDFFPPCYVFRLNKCKSLGSLQLRRKELFRARWLCAALGAQRWPGCRCVGARACAVQTPALSSRLCEPIQGCKRCLQPDQATSPRCCLRLCWWPLAERDGDEDGERSPGITLALCAGWHPPGTVSFLSRGVGEQISPTVLPTLPIR